MCSKCQKMEKEQSNSIQQSLYINGTSSRTPKDTTLDVITSGKIY